MIMKFFLLLTALLALAVAGPVTNPIQTTPALGNCECKYPNCPLELVAVSFLTLLLPPDSACLTPRTGVRMQGRRRP
jgi:hypothetical protein